MARAIQEFAEGRELICNISNVLSPSGTNGNAGQVNSLPADSALIGMTKAMSKDWGRYNVCFNGITFRMIETQLTKRCNNFEPHLAIESRTLPSGLSSPSLKGLTSSIPLDRPGIPDEAAGSNYILCVFEINQIGGQVLIKGCGLN